MTSNLSRRSFLAISGSSALGLFGVAGCSSGSGTTATTTTGSATSAATGVSSAAATSAAATSAAVQAGKVAKLDWWAAFSSVQEQKYFLTNFVDAFNGSSKDAKVAVALKQVATIDRLTQTALAAGKGPDIVQADGPSQAATYALTGNLLPLDPYIDTLGWRNNILPWALETGKVGGKLYSLPNAYETEAIFYNPATFKAHGWTPPTTRAQFEAICSDAKSKGIMPVAAGSAEWKPATEWHVSWVWNTFAGPQALYEALTGKRPWTDPVFVDAITAMKSWWDQGWFGGSTDRYFTNKFGPLYSDLASGKAAMMVTGTWAFLEIGAYFGKAAHNTAEWDWAPLPSMSSGVAPGVFPLSVGGVYGINSKCASPAQGAEFVDFLISNPQRQTAALGAIGHEPSPIKLSPGDFPSTVDPRLKRAYVDLGSSTNVGYTTWTFWPAKSDTYIYTEMDKVLTGQTTPQQYCAGLNTIFQTELKTGKNPAVPSPLGA